MICTFLQYPSGLKNCLGQDVYWPLSTKGYNISADAVHCTPNSTCFKCHGHKSNITLYLLPPAMECGEVMFSLQTFCLPVCLSITGGIPGSQELNHTTIPSYRGRG